MFANIFADKSDNFFLDPWRYIRRHDICNTDVWHTCIVRINQDSSLL